MIRAKHQKVTNPDKQDLIIERLNLQRLESIQAAAENEYNPAVLKRLLFPVLADALKQAKKKVMK